MIYQDFLTILGQTIQCEHYRTDKPETPVRSQEFKDAQGLKDEWVGALVGALNKLDLKLPIPVEDVRFPYYGQALFDLVDDVPDSEVADVIVQGAWKDTGERDFLAAVAAEMQQTLPGMFRRLSDGRALHELLGCEPLIPYVGGR